jgi:hypothetical protein
VESSDLRNSAWSFPEPRDTEAPTVFLIGMNIGADFQQCAVPSSFHILSIIKASTYTPPAKVPSLAAADQIVLPAATISSWLCVLCATNHDFVKKQQKPTETPNFALALLLQRCYFLLPLPSRWLFAQAFLFFPLNR